MKCADVVAGLSAYADGELRGREAAAIRAHIESCESCRTRLESMLALQSRLAETMDLPVDTPDLSDQVMAVLPQRRRPVYLQFAWWGTAAACVALLIIMILSPRAPQPQRPHPTAPPPVKTAERAPEEPLNEKPEQTAAKEKPQVPPLVANSTRPPVREHRKPLPPRRRSAHDDAQHTGHSSDPVAKDDSSIAVTPDAEPVGDVSGDVLTAEIKMERQMTDSNTGCAQMEITTSAVVGGAVVRQVKHTVYYLPPNPDAQDTPRPALQTVEQVVRSS